MTVDIILQNNATITNADLKLQRFLEHEYELYDGYQDIDHSTISLLDILISIMMNSRLDTAEKVRSIWLNKHTIEVALKDIPIDLSLESEDVPWDQIELLFKVCLNIKNLGPAITTKILYRKRPLLIPIYDSVIGTFLQTNNPIKRKHGEPDEKSMIRNIKYFRELLIDAAPYIKQILSKLEMNSYKISPMRALEILIWIDNGNAGYYRACL